MRLVIISVSKIHYNNRLGVSWLKVCVSCHVKPVARLNNSRNHMSVILLLTKNYVLTLLTNGHHMIHSICLVLHWRLQTIEGHFCNVYLIFNFGISYIYGGNNY